MSDSKKDKIIELIGKIEYIISPGKVIGLDFIAVGDDRTLFNDHLYHPNPEEYLGRFTNDFFKENPSLLFSKEEIKFIKIDGPSQRHWSHEIIPPIYHTLPVPLGNPIEFKDELQEQYWNKWQEIIKSLYPYCKYLMFAKHDFLDLQQTTALFIYLDKDISNYFPSCKDVFEYLFKLFLLKDASEFLVPKQLKEITLQATKAAISEIINRNMAHHLTSHVSNRATLDKVLERLGNKYSDLSNEVFYHTVLDLLNRFNQYRDERSEYLTYITNFSSPTTAYFFQDLIRPFIENTLLMDNIAANENINYVKNENGNLLTNKLQLKIKRQISQDRVENFFAKYIDKDGGSLYCSENLPYLRLKSIQLENPYEKCELTHQDIELSLPGTLGKHALYSILENFIRNSAKHGKNEKKYGLEIILLLSDLDNEDSITVTLTDNCSYVSEERIKEFNESISSEILKRKDLGIIDMKVNACILAGEELNDENARKRDVFEAIRYEGKLAYRFKIAKPKKVVFIGEFTNGRKNNNGLYYFHSLEAFSKSTIAKSFEFAILSDELIEQHRATIACELPARILKLSEIEPSRLENLDHLYEVWLKKLRGDEKSKVHVYFEQSEKTKPTSDFLAKYANKDGIRFYPDEELRTLTSIDAPKNVLYDRHGGLVKKFNKAKSFVDINNSWILIDKNNSDFDYLSRYDIYNKVNLLPLELEEAGLLKVLIIDERVAEQSVRCLKNDTGALKLADDGRYDFEKLEITEEPNLTLFDTAWAANVFLATHLNGNPLKQEINLIDQHKLNVSIVNGRVIVETNIKSSFGHINEGRWKFPAQLAVDPDKQLQFIEINPDILILHRTKLKELISTNENIVSEILSSNPNLNLIITTGSGTTHGIEGSYKILPFSTLSSLILGKRIQKLKLSKMLLQLTKNKV